MSERLAEILSGMDIPAMRTQMRLEDLRWLQRNLAIQNDDHPNFDEAMKLINSQLKML